MKYLGINLTKYVQALYDEYYKTLIKEISKRQMESHAMFKDWEIQVY